MQYVLYILIYSVLYAEKKSKKHNKKIFSPRGIYQKIFSWGAMDKKTSTLERRARRGKPKVKSFDITPTLRT